LTDWGRPVMKPAPAVAIASTTNPYPFSSKSTKPEKEKAAQTLAPLGSQMVGTRGLEPLTPTVSRKENRRFWFIQVSPSLIWQRPERAACHGWSALWSAFGRQHGGRWATSRDTVGRGQRPAGKALMHAHTKDPYAMRVVQMDRLLDSRRCTNCQTLGSFAYDLLFDVRTAFSGPERF